MKKFILHSSPNIFNTSLVVVFLVHSIIIFNACRSEQSIKNNLIIPIEAADYSQITLNDDVNRFMHKADSASELISLDTIGFSSNGKALLLSKISNGDELNKLKVLIFAQQHGNEPSGKEAMLQLIADFANGKLDSLLDSLTFYIIPQMNPYGGDKNQRWNADGTDLNRDHLLLEASESIALHRLFDSLLPELVIDIHEYYPYNESWTKFGFYKQFDVQLGTVTNINIDSNIKNIAKKEIIPFVKSCLIQKEFSFSEYIVGDYTSGERLRYSTVDINDGRQGFGIMNTLAFIIEGINGKDSIYNIERRVKAQHAAVYAILKYAFNRATYLKSIVNKARLELQKQQPASIAIRLEHTTDGSVLQYSLKSIKSGQDTVFNVENFHPKVISQLNIVKPRAYLIPKDDTLLLSWLKKHQIKFYADASDYKSDLYQYIIKGMKAEVIEELDVNLPILDKVKVDVDKSKYALIPLNQLKSAMIVLALEPQSSIGLVTYTKFQYLIQQAAYPILRADYPR